MWVFFLHQRRFPILTGKGPALNTKFKAKPLLIENQRSSVQVKPMQTLNPPSRQFAPSRSHPRLGHLWPRCALAFASAPRELVLT